MHSFLRHGVVSYLRHGH